MYYIGVTEGKFEKKKAKCGLASEFSFTQYTVSTWRCKQNLLTINSEGAKESVTEIFIWKKNEQIKGLISNMWLLFATQYNSSLSSFVQNFRILIQVVAEKSLTEKKVKIFSGEKEKWTNEGTDKQYVAVFGTQYNSLLSSLYQIQSPKSSSCWEIFGKKS